MAARRSTSRGIPGRAAFKNGNTITAPRQSFKIAGNFMKLCFVFETVDFHGFAVLYAESNYQIKTGSENQSVVCSLRRPPKNIEHNLTMFSV